MLHQCKLSPLGGPKGASYGQSFSQTQTTPAQITFSIADREGDTGSDPHWVSENKDYPKDLLCEYCTHFATFLLSLKILPGILSLIQCLTWFQITNPASFKFENPIHLLLTVLTLCLSLLMTQTLLKQLTPDWCHLGCGTHHQLLYMSPESLQLPHSSLHALEAGQHMYLLLPRESKLS